MSSTVLGDADSIIRVQMAVVLAVHFIVFWDVGGKIVEVGMFALQVVPRRRVANRIRGTFTCLTCPFACIEVDTDRPWTCMPSS